MSHDTSLRWKLEIKMKENMKYRSDCNTLGNGIPQKIFQLPGTGSWLWLKVGIFGKDGWDVCGIHTIVYLQLGFPQFKSIPEYHEEWRNHLYWYETGEPPVCFLKLVKLPSINI